ncbi:hypothetical protein E3V33_05715 [Candidatus Marinimicrobia bacterium MT.SAG.4]|nr:hypothetical protein E3V33_05715 [Candidatus Marinimicrobia bacterium MT.SAG.4]
MRKEPKRLKRGKEFHKQVQNIWLQEAQGDILPERAITKLNGRKGRIDIFVDDDGNGEVAVAEIKDSDWGAMKPKAVRRNLNRYAKQLFDYIEPLVDEGFNVSLGIIFRKQPKDPIRMQLVEDLFDERHIPVAWEDESIEERKERSSN